MLTTPPSLLERLREAPEREAWEKFVDLYTPLFFAWTRRLGLNAHDGADLVQDLFTIVVEKIPQFEYDPRKSFRAWLQTILINRWRNRRRRRRAESLEGKDPIAPAEPPEFEEVEYRQYLV